MPPRRAAVLLLLVTAGLALLIDATTKHLALAALEDEEPVRLLGGAVYLTVTRNSGAAFSLAADHTWVFPIIAIVMVGWIGWMARRLRSRPWALALGLVLGGALGNLADRLFRAPGPFVGHVVDMVSVFDPYGRVFPVFNAADSALVCGVALAILLELTGRQRDGTRADRTGPDDGSGALGAGAGSDSEGGAGLDSDQRSGPAGSRRGTTAEAGPAGSRPGTTTDRGTATAGRGPAVSDRQEAR